MAITIKTEDDIKKLRYAGKLLGKILNQLEEEVVPGNTTLAVDDMAMQLIEENGLVPLLLGYHPSFAPRPYPAATCISINDEVVHGIPNETPKTFADGDVVSIDLVVGYENVVVDSARTVGCGELSGEGKELLSITEKALKEAVKAAKEGNRVRDIGAAIEQVVPSGYGIVEALSGHGVGYDIHEEPFVPNYVMKGESPVLKAGMVLAIEPMIIKGSKDVIFDETDGYSVISADGGLSAHMEHTVLVTKKGGEILTPKNS